MEGFIPDTPRQEDDAYGYIMDCMDCYLDSMNWENYKLSPFSIEPEALSPDSTDTGWSFATTSTSTQQDTTTQQEHLSPLDILDDDKLDAHFDEEKKYYDLRLPPEVNIPEVTDTLCINPSELTHTHTVDLQQVPEQSTNSNASGNQRRRPLVPCETCEKSFEIGRDMNISASGTTNQHSGSRHILTHVKPFKCPKCGKSVGVKKDLQRHHISHHPKYAEELGLNIDPIPCGEEGCDQTFTRKDNRNRHLWVQHGIKTTRIKPTSRIRKKRSQSRG